MNWKSPRIEWSMSEDQKWIIFMGRRKVLFLKLQFNGGTELRSNKSPRSVISNATPSQLVITKQITSNAKIKTGNHLGNLLFPYAKLL
ncbi:hypothetical protein GOBAR_DD20414 [Gossypium barbadense]|nr:hypothetical protein GOBAR_DD20414 [Gossypium barbadense]